MPSASDHVKDDFVKFLFIGASGAGKTGALTSLVKAGYELRIIDLDGGLDSLIAHCRHENLDLSKIQYQSFRDKIKMTNQGPKVDGAPKAYVQAMQALERWPDDESDPASWGAEKILVLDSLTNAGRAAFQWARAMNPTTKDPRQWYSAAQAIIEDLIANLTSESFGTNVIVISHIELVTSEAGITKGYASSIGKALGPKLPRFFNTMILSEPKGFGESVKRTIKTLPTSMIDLKNPAPFKIKKEYGIENGLAEIFAELKA